MTTLPHFLHFIASLSPIVRGLIGAGVYVAACFTVFALGWRYGIWRDE